MKFLKKIFEAITYPFIAVAVLADETRLASLEDEECKRIERRNRRQAAFRKG